MNKQLTAHDIAADPNLYFSIVTIGNGKIQYSCLGYAGKLIKFAYLKPTHGLKARQINRYIHPETPVTIWLNPAESFKKGQKS